MSSEDILGILRPSNEVIAARALEDARNVAQKNPLEGKILKPDYAESKKDLPRIELIVKTEKANIKKSVRSDDVINVFQSVEDIMPRIFFGLNTHQNSFLYESITEITQAIMLLVTINNLEEGQKILSELFPFGDHDGIKIEINLVNNSKTHYQYTVTQKNPKTKKDFYSVSCTIEADEKRKGIVCKNMNKTLSPEAAGYLNVKELVYNYSDEIFYPLNQVINLHDHYAEISSNLFKYSWAAEKNKIIFLVGESCTKNQELKSVLEKKVNEYMVTMEYYLASRITIDLEKDDERNILLYVKKRNSEFVNGIKKALIAENKTSSHKINSECEASLVSLQIRSTQPFMQKSILKIQKNTHDFKGSGSKADLNKSVESLMWKTNNFYNKSTLNPVMADHFFNDINKDIENHEDSLNTEDKTEVSILSVLYKAACTTFDYFASLFFFSQTKPSETVKILSEVLPKSEFILVA